MTSPAMYAAVAPASMPTLPLRPSMDPEHHRHALHATETLAAFVHHRWPFYHCQDRPNQGTPSSTTVDPEHLQNMDLYDRCGTVKYPLDASNSSSKCTTTSDVDFDKYHDAWSPRIRQVRLPSRVPLPSTLKDPVDVKFLVMTPSIYGT